MCLVVFCLLLLCWFCWYNVDVDGVVLLGCVV